MSKKKIEILQAAPEDLIIIGLDTDDGPEHPRWDKRINLPLSDSLVAGIQRGWFGCVSAVETKNGLEIVYGRQRTRGARKVNEIRRESGLPPIQIWVQVAQPGDEDLLEDISIMENEGRQNDDSLTRAQKLAAFMSARPGRRARTVEEAAVAFNCSVASINSRLQLLTLAPEVQTAVESGQMSQANALALRELTMEAQAEAVRVKLRALAKGKRPPRVTGEAPTPSTKPTKREVIRLTRCLGGETQLALLWAIGEISYEAAAENKVLAEAFSKTRRA